MESTLSWRIASLIVNRARKRSKKWAGGRSGLGRRRVRVCRGKPFQRNSGQGLTTMFLLEPGHRYSAHETSASRGRSINWNSPLGYSPTERKLSDRATPDGPICQSLVKFQYTHRDIYQSTRLVYECQIYSGNSRLNLSFTSVRFYIPYSGSKVLLKIHRCSKRMLFSLQLSILERKTFTWKCFVVSFWKKQHDFV